jgi:hypothetical protein
MKPPYLYLFICTVWFFGCQKPNDIPKEPEKNTVLFTKYIGHSWEWDDFNSNILAKTPDGGFVVAYHDWDPLNDKGDLDRQQDIRLAKFNNDGKKIWDQAYTSQFVNFTHAVTPTLDRGYILAGSKARNFQWYGYSKMYVIKTDEAGNKVWDRTFGSELNGQATSIAQNIAGDFYVMGRHTQRRSALLIKLSSAGRFPVGA